MKTAGADRQLITRAEVAEIFQVSAATVGRWTREGKLPYRITLGGHHRYPREEIERLANSMSFGEEGGIPMQTTEFDKRTQQAEKRGLMAVLERAAEDDQFLATLADNPARALSGYQLTQPERAALASGDIRWIEENFGKLDEKLAAWLMLRMQQESEHMKTVRDEMKAVESGGLTAVLARAAEDDQFLATLAEDPQSAMMDYDLTQPERAALASGDIRWIEENYGTLDEKLATWLTLRMQQESW